MNDLDKIELCVKMYHTYHSAVDEVETISLLRIYEPCNVISNNVAF